MIHWAIAFVVAWLAFLAGFALCAALTLRE
jgi:hypothetical protein